MSGKEVIAEVVGRALDTAKENPDMRAAGSAFGASLRIVAETVRTALLPLAVANLGVRRFEDYLRGKFADELDKATAAIPEESLQEPPLSIAGPVMQGLAYSYESENLREMFLALLATSMDSSRELDAHPAFAEIIRQLHPREGLLLRAVLANSGGLDIVRYQATSQDSPGSHVLQEHVLCIWADEDTFPQLGRVKTAAFVDNWARLGLIEVDYSSYFTAPGRYSWVDSYWLTDSLREQYGNRLTVDRGSLTLTAWGRQFARALGVADGEHTGILFNGAPPTPKAAPVDAETMSDQDAAGTQPEPGSSTDAS